MKLEKKCFQRAKLGHECDSCGVESPWTNLPMATYWEKLPELIVIGKLSQENMKNLKDVLSFFLHILSPTEPKVKTLSSGELAGATISGKCRPSGSKSSNAPWLSLCTLYTLCTVRTAYSYALHTVHTVYREKKQDFVKVEAKVDLLSIEI